MKSWLLILLGVGALVAAGRLGNSSGARSTSAAGESPTVDKRPHVEISRPIRKSIYRKLALPGDVLPYEQATIYARVHGYLESIGIDRGDRVKAGSVLAKIAVPELEKKLARQTAERALCGPKIQRNQAELDWRGVVWRRLKEVSEQSPDLVNRESLDDALGRYRMAEAELALTHAEEEVLQATIEETQTLLDLASVRAPFDGVVTERWVDAGDLIQPGLTKLVHIVKSDPVRVRIHVPQSDVHFIPSDGKAETTFDEIPGRKFSAPVARFAWALSKSTRSMTAEIDLENGDGSIRPGMFGHVFIAIDPRPDALVLPATALVTEKKKAYVYVVREGVARKIPIRIGLDDGLEVQVIEGIDDHDEVVITGKSLVTDGEPVRTTTRP